MRHNATPSEARRFAAEPRPTLLIVPVEPPIPSGFDVWGESQESVHFVNATDDVESRPFPFRPGERLEIYRTVEFEDVGKWEVEKQIGSPLIVSATAKQLGDFTGQDIAAMGYPFASDGDFFRSEWLADGREWNPSAYVWVIGLDWSRT